MTSSGVTFGADSTTEDVPGGIDLSPTAALVTCASAVAPVSDEKATASSGRTGGALIRRGSDRAEALWAVSERMVGEQFATTKA